MFWVFWNKDQLQSFFLNIYKLELIKMSLENFNKVFSNDFLHINKINLTNLFEEITSGSYSGMESSLWGSNNHSSNAFPVKQKFKPIF